MEVHPHAVHEIESDQTDPVLEPVLVEPQSVAAPVLPVQGTPEPVWSRWSRIRQEIAAKKTLVQTAWQYVIFVINWFF